MLGRQTLLGRQREYVNAGAYEVLGPGMVDRSITSETSYASPKIFTTVASMVIALELVFGIV